MINFKTIIRIIGILLLLETVMFLVCSGVSFYYRESDMLDFWKAGGITAGVGLLLAALGKGGERQLTRRDGYVLVSFAWVAFSLFGMLPFYIGGYIPDIANAFFETMSGFSSTGATILDDIESLPHGILFWRSMTQWIGGLGIIMFTIAVLPIFGVSGLQVFAAEASGPTHDKVHPRIGITAKWILEYLCRHNRSACRPADAWRYGLVRQHLSCFCHYRHRRLFHQAGKRRPL